MSDATQAEQAMTASGYAIEGLIAVAQGTAKDHQRRGNSSETLYLAIAEALATLATVKSENEALRKACEDCQCTQLTQERDELEARLAEARAEAEARAADAERLRLRVAELEQRLEVAQINCPRADTHFVRLSSPCICGFVNKAYRQQFAPDSNDAP